MDTIVGWCDRVKKYLSSLLPWCFPATSQPFHDPPFFWREKDPLDMTIRQIFSGFLLNNMSANQMINVSQSWQILGNSVTVNIPSGTFMKTFKIQFGQNYDINCQLGHKISILKRAISNLYVFYLWRGTWLVKYWRRARLQV